MTKPSTPTARHFRHKVSKALFVAHLHLLGKPGLTQDEQLAAIDASIALTSTALGDLGELRELIQSRKAEQAPIDIAFDAIVKGVEAE